MVQFCYLRLYLTIETISCRLLQWLVRKDMDYFFKYSKTPRIRTWVLRTR